MNLTILQIIEVLVIISIVATLVKWIRLPYTIALILAGLLLSILIKTNIIKLNPQLVLKINFHDLILFIFLPALLFEGSFKFSFSLLKRFAKPIFTWAFLGMLVSTFIIASLIHYLLNIPWEIALLFGAIISSTDPISVLAILKEYGLSNGVAAILEGESLFNDGVSVVLYGIFLECALGEKLEFNFISTLTGVIKFLKFTLGGTMVGISLGYIFSKIIAKIDDHLIEITLTTILAYGTYLLANDLHFSGVIGVVVAGIIFGNRVKEYGMSANTRLLLTSFWDYIVFLCNSVVFLLMGLVVGSLEVFSFNRIFLGVLLAILITLAGRAVIIYGFAPFLSSKEEIIPWSWRHILFWGGIHGSLSMALALGIPGVVSYREVLIIFVFGVVLFSMLCQGFSLKWLLKLLGMKQDDPARKDYQRILALLIAKQSGQNTLWQCYQEHFISMNVYKELSESLFSSIAELKKELAEKVKKFPFIVAEQKREAKIKSLIAQKSALIRASQEGLIKEEIKDALSREIDEELYKLIQEKIENEKNT